MTKCLRAIPPLTVALVGLSYSYALDSALAEDLTCLPTGSCGSPIPFFSEQCSETRWPRIGHGQAHNIVVLSAHSSRIEQDNGYRSDTLNELDSWTWYNLSDHGVAIKVPAVCN